MNEFEKIFLGIVFTCSAVIWQEYLLLLLKEALGITKLRFPYPQVLFAGCFGIEGLLDRAGGWEGMLVLNFSKSSKYCFGLLFSCGNL